MSKARDIANILSANTAIATDAEVSSAVSAAVSAHASDTTSIHGISDTAALATQTYVQNNKGINKGNTASRAASPSNGDLYYNTETSILEVYDDGWWLPNATPGIPTSVIATNQSLSRAYNNGSASISFTPSTSGGKAISYTVTSTPGSYTANGSSSPLTITGLQSSTQYTYTVTATGPLGTSAASSASTGVTATTVPQAPTIGTATSGDAQASVTFTAGATGGSAITGYTVTSSPGNITASGVSSPITVTGLTNDTAYTFTVTADNTNGTSLASSASSSVTPVAPPLGSYESIATYTVSGSPVSNITFNNIPQTYKHLQVRFLVKNTLGVNDYSNLLMTINGDSNTYRYFRMGSFYNSGGTVSNGANIGTYTYGLANAAMPTSGGNLNNIYGAGVLEIPNYTDATTKKTLLGAFGFSSNSNPEINFFGGSTTPFSSPITDIVFTGDSDQFSVGSTISIYGIKE